MEGARERCQKANFSILPAPCSLMSKTTKEGTFRWTQASENHRCRGRSNSINVAGPKKVFNLSRPSAADAADKAEQKKQFEQLRRWNFWNHSSRCERARGERERGRASRQSGLKIFSLFDFGGRTDADVWAGRARGDRCEWTAAADPSPSARPSFQGTEILCSLLKSVTQSEKGMESIPARPSE